jgi:poly(3-hydroxyalkanoate) synthetase
MTGDLGAGRFDGAWLVQNFENLDPANTLWSKQYNLYANVDSEGPRYLGFEKYWGGHVFLEAGEMQYIVDNLFIGNKLATAELCTSDGVRIDLRNIRSPIVVFCSYGDNITPPPQALGWITDLYRDDDDVIGHDQTIVFATHDSIGHLGIFVSGSVGTERAPRVRRQHRHHRSAAGRAFTACKSMRIPADAGSLTPTGDDPT